MAAADARGRALTLFDLSVDELDKVLTFLDPDDELAASLACRKLRDAVHAQSARPLPPRTLQTGVCSLLGSLGKLQWGIACGARRNPALLARVAGLGDLRMLSWLRARGCPWPASFDALMHIDGGGPCEMAAAGGHLSALQWLRTNGCPWNGLTCAQAAKGGHLSVLQWARTEGCPWAGFEKSVIYNI
jgi:hypothetical protein